MDSPPRPFPFLLLLLLKCHKKGPGTELFGYISESDCSSDFLSGTAPLILAEGAGSAEWVFYLGLWLAYGYK